MTGLNHATTGVLIALAIPNPAISLPLAFTSHFVLDSLPHYGNQTKDWADISFRRMIHFDAVVGFTFVIAMMFAVPGHWAVIALCAIMAALPDIMWLPNFIRRSHGESGKPYNRIMRLHQKLQFEMRFLGIIAEIVWLVAIVVLLTHFVFLRALAG